MRGRSVASPAAAVRNDLWFIHFRRLSTMTLMENRVVRLAKPLYETLPYIYIVAGLLAIGGSWLLGHHWWSDVALILGIFCVLGGVVVLLRRRDYRASRAEYPGRSFDDNPFS